MEITKIQNDDPHLTELIERALKGEDVIITRDGNPLVRLVPITTDTPRTGGQWKGRVHIADDFDELPADIAEAFGVVQDSDL